MLKKNIKNAAKLVLGILLMVCAGLYLVPYTRELIDLNIYFVSASIWVIHMLMSLAYGEMEPEIIMMPLPSVSIIPIEGEGVIEQPKTVDDMMQIKARELGVV